MHLWQQGVHELDTILSVVQQPLRRVWGLSNNPAWSDWPTPCTFQAIAEYDGGVSGTYVGTSNARAGGFEFRLECAEAGADCGADGRPYSGVFWSAQPAGGDGARSISPTSTGSRTIPQPRLRSAAHRRRESTPACPT